MRGLAMMNFAMVASMANGFIVAPPVTFQAGRLSAASAAQGATVSTLLSTRSATSFVLMSSTEVEDEVMEKIVNIRPKAMDHLQQLRQSQGNEGDIFLRMGVRSGGCSGLSYIMNLVKKDDITEDDMVEEYDGFKCVIDPKSVLYLFGLELDFSDALIGGGFQFQNPNAESSCGCGKSFGV
ncbi:unnamed protein product [Pylaiella littoralis]